MMYYKPKTILIFDDSDSMTCTRQLSAALAHSFEGEYVRIIKGNRHNFADLVGGYKPQVIVLPEIKGERSYYNDHLGDNGKHAIRNAVADGAMLVGFCAGAYFICDNIIYAPAWGEKKTRDNRHTLSMFNATAFGPLPRHGRPSNGKEDLGGCVLAEIDVYDGKTHHSEFIWYGNGPMFIPNEKRLPENARILAGYRETGLNGGTGIAACIVPYGNGHVIPCGVLPHNRKTEKHGQRPYLWDVLTHEIRQQLFAFKPALMVRKPV